MQAKKCQFMDQGDEFFHSLNRTKLTKRYIGKSPSFR